MDGGREDEPLGVHEQMALAAFDLLAPVVAAHAADAGGLDGLRVNYARAGLRVASQAHAQPFAQDRMDMLPRPIQPPFAKVVKDRLPGRELPR